MIRPYTGPTTGIAPPPTPGNPCQSPADFEEQRIIAGLVAVLEKTQSVDAFMLVTELLASKGAKARSAVPAIIQNAERLKLLDNNLLKARAVAVGHGAVIDQQDNLAAAVRADLGRGVAMCVGRICGIEMPTGGPIPPPYGPGMPPAEIPPENHSPPTQSISATAEPVPPPASLAPAGKSGKAKKRTTAPRR